MLYWVCLIQIGVYLFLAPLARVVLDSSQAYYFEISVVFLMSYLLGARLIRHRGRTIMVERIQLRVAAVLLLGLYSILYSYISLKYGLYNRRIGTETLAELFALIPFYEIIAFRVFEVILPFVLALIIIKLSLERRRFAAAGLNIAGGFAVISVLVAVFLSGALNSRSQLGFLVFSIIIIGQNAIHKSKLIKYLKVGALIGLVFFAAVTLSRLNSLDDKFSGDYFIAEFITRLDGLELLSSLIADRGMSWTGIDFSILFFPLVSMVPFLPQAIELKAAALTTVKANILFLEYGSVQRDINSFVVLDIYYTSGVLGLAFAGLLIGFAAKWVDRNILCSTSMLKLALAASFSCNLIFMEREFTSHVLGVLRDWIIFYIFGIIFISKIHFRNRSEAVV